MKRIVFATNNEHKLSEVRQILGNNVEVLSLNDIGCHEDIPETGQTLQDNALQKANYVFSHYHVDCFADDTGLEVEALDGAPGIYSARYAAMENNGTDSHDSEANMSRLLRELGDNDNRRARFRTIIALVEKCQGKSYIKFFQGIVSGEITHQRSGAEGFGYDPIFRPDGYQQTFAELGTEVKNQISHRARATKQLADYLLKCLITLFVLLPLSTFAQIGTWKAYMSYYEPQQIVKAGNDLFVRASNNLYQYNLNEQSITTYDNVTGLSDTYITNIGWNAKAQRLVVVYQNSNIDLLSRNGKVVNVSDIYYKSMTDDKTVNSICMDEQYAYLATGFGIVKLNVSKAEITESYILSENIVSIAISGGRIYAQKQNKQVLAASLADNLIDVSNWSAATAPAGIFDVDNTDWNEYIATVNTLLPGGPKYNHFYESRYDNGRLYTTGGYFLSGFPDPAYPGTIQILQNGEWTFYQEQLDTITGYKYLDINCIDYDPTDVNHVFAGGRCGLYEFQNGKLVKAYNQQNSPLGGAIDRNNELGNDFTLVHGIKFDSSGNLWVLNSQARGKSLFMLAKDGTWNDLHNTSLQDEDQIGLRGLRSPFIDSRGLLWFVNSEWRDPALLCYDINHKTLEKYDDIVNQDGTRYEITSVNCVCEDREKNIWFGTNLGPFMILASDVDNRNIVFQQVKVPRNDGTSYADYLLNGVSISSIAIDGANRKWFCSSSAGAFLISDDNMLQLQNFTNSNSKLLDDNVLSVAINNRSGEVFFLTEKGLCSYMGDATEPVENMVKDDVYAYPNPVTHDYSGLITINGLSFGANVMILSTSGKLIAQGRSNGGTFTWDGRDTNGHRVASGIYMVAASTADGKKGTVCKIAFIK